MSAMRRQVREIVLRGGKEKEELLEALGLHSKFLGQYVVVRVLYTGHDSMPSRMLLGHADVLRSECAGHLS